MEFRKNDILTLDIEDCGVDGEGIGKADGFTVFVKDAVIGDRIKAKIIKAKKELWLWPPDGGDHAVSIPCEACLLHCPPVRRMPASGIILRAAAEI